MKWRAKDEEPQSIADLQSEEPVVEWKDVHKGNRISHRFYPHHYARVLVARGTRSAYAPVQS
jgi:hypothetical protein